MPAPVSCAMCGAFFGLLAGGTTQCFPVWVGAATGCSVGSVICLFTAYITPSIPVATIVVSPFIHEVTGHAKPLDGGETIVHAKFPHAPL